MEGELAEPGHKAALSARSEIEAALFALPDVPIAFDRRRVRDNLLRAMQYLYAVLDNPVIATVHLDGLTEGRAVVAETRGALEAAGDASRFAALADILTRLHAAEATLRGGAEAVANIQMARRDELARGSLDTPLPPPRPFRASFGVPNLHAIARAPMLPVVIVDPKNPLPDPPKRRPVVPKPKTLDDLAAFTDAVAEGTFELPPDDAHEAPASPEDAASPAAAASIEADLVRRVARDCLDSIANHRNLRKPNAIESWLDQEPFEQRLLENVDAFAGLGGAALPLVSLYHAEAEAPDAERAFAVALTLGCIEGSDTAGAAVTTLKQSAPEERPGWLEGFWLAPSPAIDAAMADLTTSPRPQFVAFALDVLHARGTTPLEVLAPLLAHGDAAVSARVARALGAAHADADALPWLTRASSANEDELFFAAAEALLQRGDESAIEHLRRAVGVPGPRSTRALPLLCLVASARDFTRLVDAVMRAPTPRAVRALGRFGHVESAAVLEAFLAHEDPELVAAAAEALDRITGAGLRQTVEEPWEIELPPEVPLDQAPPMPRRKVERVATDRDAWRAWLEANLPHLDARVKTRGGRPFQPIQLVDELEARATPPHARETAALELRLITGVSTPFSPEDWVARQRRYLSDLRAMLGAHAAHPGRWPFDLPRAAQAEPARSPTPRPSPRPSTMPTPFPPSASTPPPAPLPAMRPEPVTARDKPAPFRTMLGMELPKGPALPFQAEASKPASVAPPPPSPPPPPAPTPPSPRPSAPPPRAAGLSMKTSVGFVVPQAPVLPFQNTPPATTAPTPPSTPPPRRDPLMQTSVFVLPLGPALPFANAPDRPAPGSVPPSPPPEATDAHEEDDGDPNDETKPRR
jgi:hypothetical protein